MTAARRRAGPRRISLAALAAGAAAACLLTVTSAAAGQPKGDQPDALRARWGRPAFTHPIAAGALAFDAKALLAGARATPLAKPLERLLAERRKPTLSATERAERWCALARPGAPAVIAPTLASLCWVAQARVHSERQRELTLHAEHAALARWAGGPRATTELLEALGAFLDAYRDRPGHPLGAGVKAVRKAWAKGQDAQLPDALHEAEQRCDQASALHCAFAGALLEDVADQPGRGASARRRYEQACTMGEDLGCTSLAFSLASGRGGPRDAPAAQTLLTAACGRRYGPACGLRGALDQVGVDGPQRPGRARSALRAGAEAGDPYAAAAWGALLWTEDHADAGALEWLRRACDAGGAEGCGRLADLRATRAGGGDVAPQRGYALACRGGAPWACSEAARRIAPGRKPKRAAAAARERLALWRHGCLGGWPEACVAAAAALRGGSRGAFDGLALALSRRACAAGAGAGCVAVGRHLEAGAGVAPDPAAARDRYRAACESGALERGAWPPLTDARGAMLPGAVARAMTLDQRRVARTSDEACLALARMLAQGLGGPSDPAGAVGVLESACGRGVARACGALAERLRGGTAAREGPDRAARAAEMLERACKLGDGASCTHRAEALLAADPGSAAALLERACAAHDLRGCAALGELLVAGRGVQVDGPRGNALLLRACEGGLGVACATAAHNRAVGIGVPKNRKQAKRLLKRACAAGHEAACKG